MPKPEPHVWGDVVVPPGASGEVALAVSESYSGLTLPIPVFVRRGLEDGPAVFVTAALHGDELNGTGAIRQLIGDPTLQLKRGTLLLAPIINLLGFDRHSRYLPDRRDLNRCFPGSAKGSHASRLARILFDEIVGRCDCLIDLHTAAVRRTNFPNVRADLTDPAVAELARAFGAEIIVDGRGPEGSLRREACLAGKPTIILEGGEVWKVEPTVVEYAVRGVKNVLSHLGMIDQPPTPPAYQVEVRRTEWVRADHGGFLQMHVGPGDTVRAGDPVATNTSLVGSVIETLYASADAVVLGVVTIPSIAPGDPICHLGLLEASQPGPGARGIDRMRDRLHHSHPHARAHGDLATNLIVTDEPPVDLEDDLETDEGLGHEEEA
ncbi:aspartoacylase [Botrimarina colliarenosi]|uniref:Aspartoacylase n=1 Tax=Botrimarina colliarenosi TaxID=2528001 RepID=A0A5C6A4B2_9BACT|nr:succinylglutamate desuccinylase/aspartoacylase family protein [Botrimarina colliarenosi]TWT94772.1 aspartoacylase [Botrimarina colliarenosi]